MKEQTSPGAGPSAPNHGAAAGLGSGRFRLLRYYTITTLIAFVAVAALLAVLQRGEEVFFDQVQREQLDALTQAQAALARQNEAAARESLLAVHEANHVNLTRLVANVLWASDFGPLVGRAQAFDVEPCRAQGIATAERRACQADVGRRIRALPGFASLDAKVYAAMKSTSVFKVKVWDLRGIAVYSSEQGQVGDDGAANMGWQTARAGQPASELTRRDRFSAFERVVENRDLISTYVPVREAAGSKVLGVVELYSDVTPFLAEIKATSERFAALSAANEAEVRSKSRDNLQKLDANSTRFLLTVNGLLALLYGALLVIVYNGQRIIDRQSLAQARAAEREQRWHREKMAALSTMAANVSHEVGNPLAVIAGVAQALPDAEAPGGPARRILEQTTRIAAMMRQVSDFAAAKGATPDWVDVNAMVKAVCDFHAFDRRMRSMPIEFTAGAGLPACLVVPEQLNEVLMTVLQGYADSVDERRPCGGVHVRTRHAEGMVVIALGCGTARNSECDALARLRNDGRLAALQARMQAFGARLIDEGHALQIHLAARAGADAS